MPADPHGAAEIGPGPRRRPGRRARAGGSAGTAPGGPAPPTGPTPGPPPPWGMQNVLCRLRCDTSAPNRPGLGQADHGVEVGAVEVHLAAGVVHEVADLADRLLEHAVGRRVRDHQRGDAARRARRAWPAGRRGRRCRRRRRRRPPPACRPSPREAALVPWADDGMRHTSRPRSPRLAVVRPDGEQPGQLALRAGVGLQRHGVVAGDLDQPALEVVDQRGVPRRPGRRGRTGASRRTPAS